MRKVIVSIVLAAAGTGFLAICPESASFACWKRFNILIGPAWILASMASGNVHAPNEIVFWASLFLMLFVVAYLVVSVVGFVRTRLIKRGAG